MAKDFVRYNNGEGSLILNLDLEIYLRVAFTSVFVYDHVFLWGGGFPPWSNLSVRSPNFENNV